MSRMQQRLQKVIKFAVMIVSSIVSFVLLMPNNMLSNPFYFTCLSFNDMCIKYNISANLHCIQTISLLEADFYNNITISPLFVLSFRREFMSYIISANPTKTCQKTFYKLFQAIHESNFHFVDKLILSHTHISKSAGTRIENTQKKIIENIFNVTTNSLPINTSTYSTHNLPHTGWIFGGVRQDTGWTQNYFISCKHLYRKISSSKTIRFGTEIPLTNRAICSEFYNSVVIRDPIIHSLSFLAYKAFLNSVNISGFGGLLCKTLPNEWNEKFPCYIVNEKNHNKYSKCFTVEQMEGLIEDLFDVNADFDAVKVKNYVAQNWSCNHKEYQQVMVKYFNDNYKFGTIYQFDTKREINWFKNVKLRFDTTQLKAWVSNTAVRWLGYNLVNNSLNELYFKSKSFVMNAMYVDVNYINENHLREASRILLQFDYVLTLSNENCVKRYFKDMVEEPIWKFFWKESKRIFLQNNVVDFGIWDTKHNISHIYDRRNRENINSYSLYSLYSKSKELDKLYQLNQFDLKLFELSKFIAYLDMKFYDSFE